MNFFANYLFSGASLLDGIDWSSSWRSLYRTPTSNESIGWNNKNIGETIFITSLNNKRKVILLEINVINLPHFCFFDEDLVSTAESLCMKRYQQIIKATLCREGGYPQLRSIPSYCNRKFPGRFLSAGDIAGPLMSHTVLWTGFILHVF